MVRFGFPYMVPVAHSVSWGWTLQWFPPIFPLVLQRIMLVLTEPGLQRIPLVLLRITLVLAETVLPSIQLALQEIPIVMSRFFCQGCRLF